MKKIILIIVAVLLLAFAYWTISPFFIDKKVSEEWNFSPDSGEPQPVLALRGSFEGFDKIHTGSGSVNVLEVGERYYIRFEEDFDVANGPDLYVGLGKDGKYIKGTEIARLKGNVGSQNYEVPESIDISEYNEVWIWCEAFSVGFAKARLVPSI